MEKYLYKLGIEGKGRGYRIAEFVATSDEELITTCQALFECGTAIHVLAKGKVSKFCESELTPGVAVFTEHDTKVSVSPFLYQKEAQV